MGTNSVAIYVTYLKIDTITRFCDVFCNSYRLTF